MKTEQEMSKDIFELSENSIYKMMENLKDNHCVDQSLVYCFIKAFYLHAVKLYLQKEKTNFNFDALYSEYKENLKAYYKINNPDIENEVLDYILNFFDNSFALIETVEFTEIQDSYEFRHYVVNVFELLRMILENKSKATIRENIFENYTRKVVEQTDEILEYIHKNF